MPDRLEQLLTEQMRYYHARAPEYDESYTRQGRHDHGAEANARWIAELAAARRVLERLPLDGARILELAAGSGIWTETLAARASAVTAVDASAEMIARNRTRLGPLSWAEEAAYPG
jgi:ubiquinone/menaquinone biosynthesis C-methylase UbiE